MDRGHHVRGCLPDELCREARLGMCNQRFSNLQRSLRVMGKIKKRDREQLQYISGSSHPGAEHDRDLLTPASYFARYGENLSLTSSPHEAWWETEREFNRTYSYGELVFRRYMNFNSFRDAFRRWQKGEIPSQIIIHIRYVK